MPHSAQSSRKGLRASPDLEIPWLCSFQQCLAAQLHLTSGAERWIACNSAHLFDVHGQEQILHPSYLGCFTISCSAQLFILYFGSFIYVCLHNVGAAIPKFYPCLEGKAYLCPPAQWLPSLDTANGNVRWDQFAFGSSLDLTNLLLNNPFAPLWDLTNTHVFQGCEFPSKGLSWDWSALPSAAQYLSRGRFLLT